MASGDFDAFISGPPPWSADTGAASSPSAAASIETAFGAAAPPAAPSFDSTERAVFPGSNASSSSPPAPWTTRARRAPWAPSTRATISTRERSGTPTN